MWRLIVINKSGYILIQFICLCFRHDYWYAKVFANILWCIFNWSI